MPASTSTGNGPKRPTRRTSSRPSAHSQSQGGSRYQSGPPATLAPSFQPQPLIETPGPTSDTPPETVRLVVGTVVGVHGVDGEMKVRPHTDDVEQFDTFRYCYFGAEEKPRRVQSARHHGGHVLIRVHGVGDREAALLFRGFDVRVDTAQLTPLDEGEFFLYQVIGLEVLDETGSRVGTLVDLIETGSADVFVINPGAGGQHILLANQPEVVLDISPADGQIRVRLPRYLE